MAAVNDALTITTHLSCTSCLLSSPSISSDTRPVSLPGALADSCVAVLPTMHNQCLVVRLSVCHMYTLITSTPPSPPHKVCLKCPCVRHYVRPSTKSFFDFNEIWYVGRGRRVMHDGMQYDRSKVKVKVTSPSKSEIWPFSKAIVSPI